MGRFAPEAAARHTKISHSVEMRSRGACGGVGSLGALAAARPNVSCLSCTVTICTLLARLLAVAILGS